MNELIEHPLDKEEWREYEWIIPETDQIRIYRIERPTKVFFRLDSTTHRVVDVTGITHCCPAPGKFGCVLRWQNFDLTKPVTW